MLKKIVIIGPESTGKSTLCAQLACHYRTTWVKEYAREFLLTNGTEYTFETLSDIAKGQLALEDAVIETLKIHGDRASSTPSLVFIDTDMYVMKVWCEFVFGKCHQWILNEVVERSYDLYLLCNIDLPWVKDELREYPDLVTREKLFHYYKDLLINQAVPWAMINGQQEQRLERAIAAVNRLL